MTATPYLVKSMGACTHLTWEILKAFNSQSWDMGTAIIEKELTSDEKNIDTWNICFDFCRLAKKSNTLDVITTRYASIFNKPPPEWIGTDVTTNNTAPSDGITLALISVSTPESEQYAQIQKQILEKKTAVLIKFTPGKPLSWQETGVQRLASICNDIQKLKIPVFGEHIELPLLHIKKMPADARLIPDWDILFFCLKLLGKEQDFDEEALNYAMAKGMSPPTYIPFPKADKSLWFKNATVAAQEEDDISNPVIMLNGALSTHISALQNRILARLQSKPAVILDMRGLTHIDFTSAATLIKLHDKVLTNNQRKIYVVEPSVIIKKLLTTAGLSEKSLQTTAPQIK